MGDENEQKLYQDLGLRILASVLFSEGGLFMNDRNENVQKPAKSASNGQN